MTDPVTTPNRDPHCPPSAVVGASEATERIATAGASSLTARPARSCSNPAPMRAPSSERGGTEVSRYLIALFLHVSGAIGIWASLGIWLLGLPALRRARRVEQVRALAWLIVVATPVLLVSLALLGVAGFYMALTVWGHQTPWIAVSLAGMLVIGPIGAFVLDARMHTILDHAREAPDGPLPEALAARTHDPLLATGAQTQAAVLLGIIYLMTNKPPLVLAIQVMAGALALCLLSGLPALWAALRRSRRAAAGKEGRAADPFQARTIWTRRW